MTVFEFLPPNEVAHNDIVATLWCRNCRRPLTEHTSGERKCPTTVFKEWWAERAEPGRPCA